MAAGLDQRVHERVAVGERALHLHAVGVQRVEQRERAGRRVQPHRHAHLGVLGGEARQHDGHAPVGRRQRAQPRRAHGEPGHARAALGVGDVARHGHADGRVVRVALLERDDAGQQAPVELGDRDLRGRVERGQAGRAGLPRRARARRAHRLQHRHVEGDERAGVPLVGGARAAGGEHGREQRVDVAVEQRQGGDVAIAVAPQRVAPDRERVAARGLDGRAQRVDEVGVAGQAVRAVEADADRRPAGIVALEHALERHVARAGQVDAEVGDLVRRLEPVALEQEGVGEEAQELLDVVDVAVTQVLARLGHGAGRRGRERGHLGVGLGLAAQGEQGDAGGRAALLQQVEAVRPSAPPAEHPAQHHAGAVEDVGHERLVVLHAARVGAADVREVVGQAPHRRRRGEDLGVGGGDEADHAGTSVAARRTGRPVGGPEAISAVQPVGVEVVGHEVAEDVQACLARSRERGGAGGEAAAALLGHPAQQGAAEGVVLERAVPRRAQHRADAATVVVEERRAAGARHPAVADLVARGVGAEPGAAAGAAGQDLVGREDGGHREEPEAGDRAAPGLDRVVDALAQQLVAAAHAEDRRARRGAGGQRAVQAGAAQPLEVLDRRLGPGHDEQVGALDVGGRAGEAHPHPRLGRERVDVGEVAHPAQAQDGDVDGVAVGRGLGAAGLQRERVLDVHPQVLDEREDAERGAAGELGQPLDARAPGSPRRRGTC